LARKVFPFKIFFPQGKIFFQFNFLSLGEGSLLEGPWGTFLNFKGIFYPGKGFKNLRKGKGLYWGREGKLSQKNFGGRNPKVLFLSFKPIWGEGSPINSLEGGHSFRASLFRN